MVNIRCIVHRTNRLSPASQQKNLIAPSQSCLASPELCDFANGSFWGLGKEGGRLGQATLPATLKQVRSPPFPAKAVGGGCVIYSLYAA
jgi:hypothetical protein